MAFMLHIPRTNLEPLNYDLETGRVLFLLGANGSGKSSLFTRLFAPHMQNAKRISAHRQTWFESNELNLTPQSRAQIESGIRDQDRHERSRHVQTYQTERTAIAIFDLVDADTVVARKIADLVRVGDMKGAKAEAATPTPISIINDLMRASNLPIEIELRERQTVLARKNGGEPYSIAQLSDGERNAFLIAADVLTAKPNTLILLDEPERHLHRSIISPLLTALFRTRPDCSFIVSTHEIMLPIDNPESDTLLVRDCEYVGEQARSWTVDLLPSHATIDERVKIDILGGRQKIVFVEGAPSSLDTPLYSLLFPQVSVLPKSSCRDVEQAVRGLREAEQNHWVKAWGIIDSDDRDPADLAKLRRLGLHAVPFYSVEAIYYHPDVIQRVAGRLAPLVGKEPRLVFETARRALLTEITRRRDHFVQGAVERAARMRVFANLPTRDQVRAGGRIQIDVDLAALRAVEEAAFEDSIRPSNLTELLRRYPVRESAAPGEVARAFGLGSRADYEKAVRATVEQDEGARQLVRGFFAELIGELEAL